MTTALNKRSEENLKEVHADMVRVVRRAATIIDLSVIEGKRSKERQAELVAQGKSKRLDGKHTTEPFSEAVDIIPLPLNWNDTKRFFFLAGVMKMAAAIEDVKIRWGGDWDGDNDFKDQTFNDLVHFELA